MAGDMTTIDDKKYFMMTQIELTRKELHYSPNTHSELKLLYWRNKH